MAKGKKGSGKSRPSKKSKALINTLEKESKTLSSRFSLAPKARKQVISANRKIINDLKKGKVKVNLKGKIVPARLGM